MGEQLTKPRTGFFRWQGVLFLVVMVIYIGAIFAVSHIPGKHLNFGFRFWDKAAHFVLYMPVGFLAMGWLRYRAWLPSFWPRLVLAVVATLAAGVFDELHQSWVPGRDAELDDVIADVLGGLAGALVATAVLGRGKPKRSSADAANP